MKTLRVIIERGRGSSHIINDLGSYATVKNAFPYVGGIQQIIYNEVEYSVVLVDIANMILITGLPSTIYDGEYTLTFIADP